MMKIVQVLHDLSAPLRYGARCTLLAATTKAIRFPLLNFFVSAIQTPSRWNDAVFA